MELTQSQQESLGLYQEVIDQAWGSESFKQELINNPKPSIEKTLGKELLVHEDTKFVVEDQTDPNTIYLNIPRQLDFDNIELSDEQLEIVAGGIAVVTISIAALCWIVGGTIVGGTAIGVGIAYALE